MSNFTIITNFVIAELFMSVKDNVKLIVSFALKKKTSTEWQKLTLFSKK